jgi:hypothetical protein
VKKDFVEKLSARQVPNGQSESETQKVRQGETLEIGCCRNERLLERIFALTAVASAACPMPSYQFRNHTFNANP